MLISFEKMTIFQNSTLQMVINNLNVEITGDLRNQYLFLFDFEGIICMIEGGF